MKIALVGIVFGGMALAAGTEQRGTVASVEGLHVNGAAVPVNGTKSWPMMAGDEVKSSSAPAVLTLKDGSKIVLGANSAAKFETAGNGASSLRLTNGSMRYTMSNQAQTQLVVNNQPLVVTPGATGSAGTPAAGAPVMQLPQSSPTALANPPLSRRK